MSETHDKSPMNTHKTTEFYDKFLKTFEELYPKTAAQGNLAIRISSQLICPVPMSFSKSWLLQAQNVVDAFCSVRNLPDRQQRLKNLAPSIPDPHHHSALMSYDFHVDESGSLRLIEINTNASMALIADTSYKTLGLKNGIVEDFPSEIFGTFLEDYREFSVSKLKRIQGPESSSTPATKIEKSDRPSGLAIVDEKPLEQRLYIEFEMYRELFEKNNLSCVIADPRDLKFHDGALWHDELKIDLVYNRDTDFHLVETRSHALREARDASAVCVTPSAFEYRLLADKERLEELSHLDAIENLQIPVFEKASLSRTLIRTQAISEFKDAAALWTDRKKYFFKPRRSFGGKAVYRGSSVSRGTFQKIRDGDYLVQDFVPPQTVKIPVQNGSNLQIQEFKYDLRFYVYRDRIQLACARLYQGQMTNSQTPGGGIAAIDWVP